MATDKPRFTITMEENLYNKVNDYKFNHQIKNQSKAIVELVRIGLNTLKACESGTIKQPAPPVSGKAMQLAKDYDTLDQWGRRAVRSAADNELARVASARAEQQPDSTVLHYRAARGDKNGNGTGTIKINKTIEQLHKIIDEEKIKSDDEI